MKPQILGKEADFPLRPGEPMIFMRESGARGVKAKSAFVGLKGKSFILADPPLVAGSPLFSVEGQSATVRFLHQGKLYGFTSKVEFIRYNPFPLIFLPYPARIHQVNLRNEDRYTVNLNCRVGYQTPDGPEILDGQITDLSLSGCRLAVNIFFDVGDTVDLSFSVGGGKDVENLEGVVRNLRTTSENMYELGISFEGERPPNLTDFINSIAVFYQP